MTQSDDPSDEKSVHTNWFHKMIPQSDDTN
jgi:hypothetical protein